MMMFIWPNGDWVVTDDDRLDDVFRHRSDDYQTVMVRDDATDEELEELAASVHKHGYVSPEAVFAFNRNWMLGA